MPEKDKWPIKSVPTLFSISTMENNFELRAMQSCLLLLDTCQNLHSWNVNDADEELKMPSNVRVLKCWSQIWWGDTLTLNPPRVACTINNSSSTASAYLPGQILSVCPPSSKRSTGWGQVGRGQQFYHPRQRSLIRPFGPSTFANEFTTPGVKQSSARFFTSTFVCWGEGCWVSTFRLWIAFWIFISLVSGQAFRFHTAKNSRIVHLTCPKTSYCRKKKAFKARMLNWRVDGDVGGGGKKIVE